MMATLKVLLPLASATMDRGLRLWVTNSSVQNLVLL